MDSRNKHYLDLSSIYSSDTEYEYTRTPKKVDTPISDKFMPEISQERYSFETKLIEFLEDEVKYYQATKLVLTVYRSLLENNPDYQNIFTTSEQLLLFEDLATLNQMAQGFLKDTFKTISRNCKLIIKSDFDEEDMVGINIPYLIYNCQLEHLDVGTIFNKGLVDNLRYKTTIVRYFGKYEFMVDMISGKSNTFPLAEKWLVEGNRLINNRVHAVTLEVLLSKPLEKLNRYPSQLKQLRDKCPFGIQYNLDLSLIKTNKILDEGYRVPKITNWDQLRELNVTTIQSHTLGELNNQLEYGIESPNEYKVDGTKANNPKPFKWLQKHPESEPLQQILTTLDFKYKTAVAYKQVVKQFGVRVKQFSDSQVLYGHKWKLVLSGSAFSDGVLEKYTEKLTKLQTTTETYQTKLHQLVKRIEMLLVHLQAARRARRIELKLQPQATQLIYKLTQMEQYMDTAMMNLQLQVLGLYKQWLYEFIGAGKVEEYLVIGKNYLHHEDIVKFYELRAYS